MKRIHVIERASREEYLTSSSYRAAYEAEAFVSEMEMEFWRQGAEFDLMEFAQKRPGILRSYGCSDQDIMLATQALQIRASVVAAGGVETEPAADAIRWLERLQG